MIAEEQERKVNEERASSLKDALQKVAAEGVTLASGEVNDELLKLLREWAAARERHH